MSRSDPRPVRNGVDRNEVIVLGAVVFRKRPFLTNDEVYDRLRDEGVPMPARETWKFNSRWAPTSRRLSGTPSIVGRPEGSPNR